MTTAKAGDTVRVHYKGTLTDGTEFDSSSGRDPIEFTVGAGAVIPGFEEAVSGMAVGDRKTVTVPSDNAYGPRQDGLVQDVERSAFPPDIDLTPGQRLQAQGANGETVALTVVESTDATVTIDLNHPLAGEDLTFELEMVDIG
jgi:peptidylprolyl isomerase